jgi:DNA (cytosine-5)-methyltransferase 1
MMRILDLFCGAGIGAYGYMIPGSHVTGIDESDFSVVYPGSHFIRKDALSMTYGNLESYHFIHASPPCQAYSKVTPKKYRANHQRLVAATHTMLYASGKPYAIENVEGSSAELKPNVIMYGNYFGLPIEKKRFFHLSWRTGLIVLGSAGCSVEITNISNRQSAIKAYGLPDDCKANARQIRQGIPPAYTKWILDDLQL